MMAIFNYQKIVTPLHNSPQFHLHYFGAEQFFLTSMVGSILLLILSDLLFLSFSLFFSFSLFLHLLFCLWLACLRNLFRHECSFHSVASTVFLRTLHQKWDSGHHQNGFYFYHRINPHSLSFSFCF
jgi:hypothetical protein